MDNILITGASGMLGKELKKVFPNSQNLNGKKDLDLTDLNFINKNLPSDYDIIIHAAAYTNMQHNEKYPTKAYNLHSEIVPILQSKCKKLIYISAQGKDYEKVYFKSKLKGEEYSLRREEDLVIRTNIYGNGGLSKWAFTELKQNNTINGYVNSMFNAIHVKQLAKCIRENLLNEKGLISVAGNYMLSKYDFIKYIAEILNLNENNIKKHYLEQYEDLVIDLKDIDYRFSLSEGMSILKSELI